MQKWVNQIEFLEDKIKIQYAENQVFELWKGGADLGLFGDLLIYLYPPLNGISIEVKVKRALVRKLYRQLSACPLQPAAFLEISDFKKYLQRRFEKLTACCPHLDPG